MSTQRVPLEALQKIRQHLRSALVLPESENHPQPCDLPEPPKPESLEELGNLFHFGSIPEETLQLPNNRGQWFISATNPNDAFFKLPGLKLKSDLRLVGYLYRMNEDGTGVIWAVPEKFSTTAQLERAPSQAQWQWRTDSVKDLSPKVRAFSDGRVAVEFFTCRTIAPIAIFQHVDQFSADSYEAKCLDRAVAIAQKAA